MSIKSQDDQTSSRKQGAEFDIEKEDAKTGINEPRQAKTFIPDQNESLSEVPEAITAGEILPHVSEYSGISLQALPLKGLKSFLIGFGSLLLVLFGWEVFSVFKSAMDIHWALAGGFALLISIVGGLGFRLLWRYLRDGENLGALENIQKQALRLNEAHDFGSAKDFINELKHFYHDKPQAVYLQRCLEQLPDYSNDREVVEHIENVFLQPLDKEALRRVSNFCLQTGAAVTASPWASLDMLLALWRSMKMIDDVAQVYGIRPSMRNRYKLLKLVMHQLAFVGATEVIIEQVIEEFGASGLTSIASVRLGQGLGAGVYTAKIGIAAMEVSRPIGFSKQNKPKLKSTIAPMVGSLIAMKSGFK